MTFMHGSSPAETKAREENFSRETLWNNLMDGRVEVSDSSISDDDARFVISRMNAVPGENPKVRDRMESQLAKSKEKLPARTADTMSEAIAMSSPSGRQSKRSKDAASKRLAKSLFGEKGLQRPTVTQPSDELVLRRRASELRGLADRGMSPRKHRKAADELEKKADRLGGGTSHTSQSISQRTLDGG